MKGMMAASAACLLLAACGGSGGGGVNSAGSTGGTGGGSGSGSSAPATNTRIDQLTVSQSFTNDAAAFTSSINLPTSTVVTGRNTSGPLTVRYDAGSQSYSITAGSFNQTFAQADVRSSDTTQVQYFKTDGTNRDYLTLLKQPYSGGTPTQYVALGFWQRNVVNGSQQDSGFGTFTYGLDTPASAVPRTGSAAFAVDVFGAVWTPGYQPRAFQGKGTFATDFAAGIFFTQTSVTESELVSGSSTVGGGIELKGAGKLSSNGTFAGNMLYGGFNGQLAGTMSGRFYGPQAQELGASFSGSDANGATVAGSFTGSLDATLPRTNLTLTNIVASQLFYVPMALVSASSFNGGPLQAYTYQSIGQLNLQNPDTFTYGPGLSNLPGGQFTLNDKVASSDANFTAWRKTFNGQEVQLELYRPGGGNTELALTYASFGRWRTTGTSGSTTETDRVFLAYGLETPAGLLGARTGTGTYNGVVYGAGVNRTTSAQYDIKGASRFDVDFTNQKISGSLTMNGTSTNGAAAVDFGSYTFAERLVPYGNGSALNLVQGGVAAGQLNTRFYGPDGEEIAGTFALTAPSGAAGAGTSIAGVTAARRQ